jgi:hypothetical protein
MAIRFAGVTLTIFLSAAGVALATGGHGPTTFEGTCRLSGTLHQRPALTSTPQEGRAAARARGTCSGTLTDRRGRTHELNDAPARYAARAGGTMSCGGGTAEGRGYLQIGKRRIRFLFSEVRGPGVAAVSLRGRRGGSATGDGHVASDEDPVAIAQKCAGPGLRSAHLDIDLAATPAISG